MKKTVPTTFHPRRGMLILLVLGMLTTFMMLGALMLVLATRSRTSARAFSSAATATSSSALQTNALLDEALMILIRGTKAPTPPAGIAASESILEDKYGDAMTGKVAAGIAPVALSSGAVDSPILLATLQNLNPAPSHPCELNGRILTLKPDPGDGDVASYRILRTIAGSGNGSFACYLAKNPFNRSRKLPANLCTAYVNGREFQSQSGASKYEPYDAFDVDKWLAKVQLGNSIVTAVPQPSYSDPTNSQLLVDNDNDGVADGVWLPKNMPSAANDERILPDLPSPLGGTLHFQVSYHVLDLDSRINLNAHGSSTNVGVQAADWTGSPSINPGLGYGTADIDASLVIADPPGAAPTSTPVDGTVRWKNLVQGGTPAPVQTAPGTDQRRPTPSLGSLEGRYCDGKPGTANQNDAVSAVFDLALQGNSPSDLQGRVKAYMQNGTAVVPTLTFFRPDWTSSDTTDDPYELRLDADAPRGSSLNTPTGQTVPPGDNPFTLAELERVLRQYDPDAMSLPQRLATLLDDYAQRSRYTVTTDSWDTPAITGDAMLQVITAMKRFPAPTSAVTVAPPSTNAVYNVLSPDVTAGLRFDVNRPLRSLANQPELPPLKQQYLQHLFTLLIALDPNNSQSSAIEKAQWAANVVDFRDQDSTMTMFPYDDNPFDGWSTDNTKIVFGAERPEVVITETLSYGSTLFVVLHHPWKAVKLDKAGTTTDAEPIDPNLQGTTANTLELRKTVPSCNDSVWRLRLDTGATLRFGDLPTDATTAGCMMATNASLCVGTSAVTTMPAVTAASLTPTASTRRVYLERLANPSKIYEDDKTATDYNPYVVVDEAPITVYPDITSAQKNGRLSTISFWRQTFGTQAGTTPAPPTATAGWFHWPNRPFISAGELILVPGGNASTMLQNYNPLAMNSLAANPLSLILDAVQVPSRFAGSAVTIGDSNLLSYLAGNEKVATTLLPTWREPGRVNVNTVLPSGGNTSNSSLDDAVWKTFIGTAAVSTNPFVSGSTSAAKSISKMLSLDASDNPVKPPYAEANVPSPRDKNSAFSYATQIRLANAGTIRSNVFAVWITLKVNDDSPNAPPDFYRRMFAIIDRSIPTGFSKGENLTARDVIRLERYLE